MADQVSPDNPAEAVAEVTKTDGITHGPITIDQFWDDNPFIMPWMEQFLPRNRMWKDGVFGVYNAVFSIIIIDLLSHVFLLPDKVLFAPGIIMIICISYLFGRFNSRMARAQGKFIRAKLNETPFPDRIRIGAQGIKEWLNP